LNLRVATPNTGAQVQVKNAGGALLSTVTLPNTGAYQTWQTTSTAVNLAAGTQTIRLQSSATPPWNINWLELVPPGVLAASQIKAGVDAGVLAPSSIDIFPNPVSDHFVLQVNNDLTGAMKVEVIDLQGKVLKQFSLTKTAAGTSQFHLSVGELAAGNYIVKVSMEGWSEAKQIVRQ
jgi:endoglucanase